MNTFPTDVVTGWEEHWSKSEDEFAQEASLRILKDLHSFQRVQMNVNGNLRFEFIYRLFVKKRWIIFACAVYSNIPYKLF